MASKRRDGLRPYLNRWGEFTAHVEAISATNRRQPTVLLKQVYDADDNFVAGHLWVKAELVGIEIGDSIAFRGHVVSYAKGWRHRRTPNQQRQYDYYMDCIQDIRKLEYEC